MARIDEPGTETRDIVHGEVQRARCRRYSNMHVGCGVEIVIGDIDVLSVGAWLWTDEQPGLICGVQAIEVVCRLGKARRALEIIEGESRRITVECTIDIGA